MAVPTDITDLIGQMNDATNAVGARIAALVAQIATGMSQADVDTIKAAFQTEVSNLQVLAADPNNPVPPVLTVRAKNPK